jgi:adenosylhomocysteine nucleosidase
VTGVGSDGMIALLAPMQSELRPLVRALSLKRHGSGDRNLLYGTLGRIEIVATTTGIGTRAAAQTAARVLDTGIIRHLVVVGVAGGIGPSVDVGDLVIPEFVVDLATGAQYRPTTLGSAKPRGKLATSDTMVNDPAQAARLLSQGVIAVDMETAAVAAVCDQRRCPWSVFRAVSDRADDGSTDPAVSGLAGPYGEPRLRAVARFVVSNPRRIRQLARLAQGLNLATSVAATSAVNALKMAYAS